jgi:two-component system cell cycle response regulator
MNILLIEDDPTDTKLLTAVLSFSGHQVFCRGSAEQAAEEIRAHQPDVILLDLKLPGMDGLKLARLLKDNPKTHAIPIVAITAAVEKFSEAEALAAGCDAFIMKPVNTRKLPDQIAKAAFTKT